MKQLSPPPERVTDVLDAYLEALEAGNAPDRATLLARHPDLVEELAAALDALDFVHRAARTLASAKGEDEALPGKALGDYRLLREIGRGGMAVVYEAEQISLGRRVALKVLPFAAVLDPKQLQRFKNEALAAAHLHHPHIVPVHGVGCERGVHYYAMQYIEGQSLAAAIRSMKGGGTGEEPKTPISSHDSNRGPAYIRMAAALGVQAAEALDHAHQLGIVHRDVKPANLLVDPAGTLWITDFGLAHSLNDVGLTITGELLGTIRYMSPEQALAKRVPIDHRTDVYSLGATLYELFTLEPAFPGNDAHIVLQNIASKDPVPPRRLNPALPRDLETVLMKAMSKDPGSRYATAQEMAHDIERYLEDKPVVARRPSVAARAARWARRHRALVSAALVVLFVGIAALAAGAKREERNTRAALKQAEANLDLARNAVDKFLVEAGIADFTEAPLPPPAQQELLREALRFYEAYPDDPASLGKRGMILHVLHRYGDALAVYDRVLAVRPADVQALVERGHMLWHLDRHEEALAALDHALKIDPGLAHAHLYRGSVLRSLGRPDEAVAACREAIRLKPDDAGAHYNLGILLREDKGDPNGAIEEQREALRLDPDDADAHDNLGSALRDKGDLEGAIEEHREAIRLRPDLAEAHYNLGVTLGAKGEIDAEVEQYREAIRLKPDFADAHCNLGSALTDKGDPDRAIASCREAIRLKPDFAEAHDNLGVALRAKGEIDAAAEQFREAIRLKPDFAEAHSNLGTALAAKGEIDAAAEQYREAIRLKPDYADAHYNLGTALAATGDRDGAIPEYREAIRLKPDHAGAHDNLGNALLLAGDPDGAIPEYREAIRLKPDLAEAHFNLGLALTATGDLDGAIAEYREAIRLKPDFAAAHRGLETAERKAEMVGRLEAVLSGEARPRDAVERVAFAGLLYAKSRHAESARMWAEAFAEDAALAGDLAQSHRYNAACSAALAAAHGDADAAEWRGRALEWLRADLAAREKAATGLADMLEHWKQDRDLAAVRGCLDELPEPEREAWRTLWAAVDRALAAARPAAK